MSVRRTKRLWKLLPLARAIGVLSAVGLITTMVTFAAIQSTGSALTGNTIQTATASLQISKDGTTYSDSVPGYNFSGIVPGASAQPSTGYTVYLKNTGTTTVRLLLNVPTPPTITGIVDLSKVLVLVTMASTGFTQTFSMSSLLAGTVDLVNNSVGVGGVTSYRIQVSMAPDAVTGNGATITGLDLSFASTTP